MDTLAKTTLFFSLESACGRTGMALPFLDLRRLGEGSSSLSAVGAANKSCIVRMQLEVSCAGSDDGPPGLRTSATEKAVARSSSALPSKEDIMAVDSRCQEEAVV